MSQSKVHPAVTALQIKPQIFTVVLTGGIASGKSTVSNLFGELGVPIIDTDEIARELVEPGMPALMAIADSLGKDFLDAGGKLNRTKLRSAIFLTPKIKAQLEKILHPRIRQESIRQVSASAKKASYCVLVVPLFVESGDYEWADRVLVVDTPEESQITRVMKRDRVSKQQAQATLANQVSRKERLSIADDVISNNSEQTQLRPQVEKLHKKYQKLSGDRKW